MDVTQFMEEVMDTVGDRANDYGDAKQSFSRIAEMWSAYKGVYFTHADVAAMMIMLKVSRLSNDPSKKDSWIDIAGYAALGGSM